MTRDEMIEALDEYLQITERRTDAYKRARAAVDALRAESREGYVLVPKEVMDAAERMAIPLDETRLSGVTARQDKRCSDLILSFLRSIAASQPPAEQAGGADESPTKYYGGPRGGSMSQNAPLAAPTAAEVLACAVERGEVTEFVAAYTLSGYYEFMRCSSINASLALIDILHMVTLDALRR